MVKRILIMLVVVLVAGFGVRSQSQPAMVELILENGVDDYDGTRDTTIYDESANSNGGGKHVFAGRTARGAQRRALIAFDLSGVSDGVTIDEVSLSLTVSRTQSGDTTVSLQRLTNDWGEGESAGFGQEGAGKPAAPEDATWSSNFHGSSDWETPGGDFAETISATAIARGVGKTVTWTSEGLVADVQAWLDGEAENFGWILIGDGTAKRLHSSDGNAKEGQKPRLIIRYTPAS